METREVKMIDVTGPKKVQIELSDGGTTLWVNVDGICLLRVQQNKLNPTPFSVALEGFNDYDLG